MTAVAAEPSRLERIQAQLAEARAERDLAFRTLDREDEQRGSWDKQLIDAAIAAFAEAGAPFSANDVRELLPDDVRTSLMGSRFFAAHVAKRIRRIGLTTSTKKNTHAKDVGQWIRATAAEVDA
jgi:hypothetical protein